MLRDPMGPATHRNHDNLRVAGSRAKVMRGFDFLTGPGFMDGFIRCGWWLVPKSLDNCGMRVVCNERREA